MIHHNKTDGIFASGGTGLVRGNVVYDNGGWGLISELVSNPTTQPGYGENTISGNDAGQVRGGTAIADNLCWPGGCP